MDEDISLEDIHRWDNQLFQLASYDVTGGLMVVPASIEESMELQKAIAKKFNYFKRLVQLGEITIDQLHESVFRKHGAIFGLDKKKKEESSVDDLIRKMDEESERRREQEIVQYGVGKIIQQLFSDLSGTPPKSNKDLPTIEMLFPKNGGEINQQLQKDSLDSKDEDKERQEKENESRKKSHRKQPRKKKNSADQEDH